MKSQIVHYGKKTGLAKAILTGDFNGAEITALTELLDEFYEWQFNEENIVRMQNRIDAAMTDKHIMLNVISVPTPVDSNGNLRRSKQFIQIVKV